MARKMVATQCSRLSKWKVRGRVRINYICLEKNANREEFWLAFFF